MKKELKGKMVFWMLLMVASAGHLIAQEPPPVMHQNHQSGVAVKGYDVVAYYSKNKAVEGNPGIAAEWNGILWNFESEEHKKLFLNNPASYAPQYGGYCAFGASRGYKADVEPQAWTIVGGKLFLNFNMNVRSLWLKDTSARITAANKYWNTLIK